MARSTSTPWRACVALVALASLASSSTVRLHDNGYEGVEVALEADLHPDLCQDIVQGLKNTFQQASQVLFSATRSRASFRKVTVLVPESWGTASCPALGSLGQSSGQTWATADIRVRGAPHPIYGPLPWALNTRGCGQQGDYISLAYTSLHHNTTTAGRRLAASWLKYRYGVLEEVGEAGNPLHPPHYLTPDAKWRPNVCTDVALDPNPECDPANATCPLALSPPADAPADDPVCTNATCSPSNATMEAEDDLQDLETKDDLKGAKSSLMGLVDFPEVTQLCDEGSHNRDAPTRHNLLCSGKSAWEVLRASPDFQYNRNVEAGVGPSQLTFEFVRATKPRIVLLIDDTAIMNVQKRWEFLRKAVRKLVGYDVPDGYSAALVVFNSAASTKYPLTRLSDGATREKLGSSLPRNPSQEAPHKRCLVCGLREALRLLREDGSIGGDHVIVVSGDAGSSGGSSGGQDAAEGAEAWQLVGEARVVVHSVTYPLTERYPAPNNVLEALAARTGGSRYVVADQGIGADSKLGMYYDLLDSLYNALAAATGSLALPVTVHAAEHPGGLVALSQGAFTLEPSLGHDAVFAIFYYDVTHVGNLVHLVSPLGHVLDTANMQKEDANINMITVRLAEAQLTPGLWRYKVENRADSHQALYVQVTSRARAHAYRNHVTVRTWTNHPSAVVNASDISRPLALYSEVTAGMTPVTHANVTATLTRLGHTTNGTQHPPVTVALLDDGLVGPDVATGDGVYSRHAPSLASGKYGVVVDVAGEVGGHAFQRHVRVGVVDVVGHAPTTDMVAPSRVTDLRAAPVGESQVAFTWTAPGGDLDYGTASRYVVVAGRSPAQVREGGAALLDGWPAPLEAHTTQHHVATWPHHDVTHYVAIYAVDEHGNTAELGNIVSVFVPAPPPTTTTTHAPPPPMAPAGPEWAADGDGTREGVGAAVVSSLDGRGIAVVVGGCVGAALLLVAALACYCLAASRRQRKSAAAKKAHEAHQAYTLAVATAAAAKAGGLAAPDVTDGARDDDKKQAYMSPVESWSASQLLSHDATRTSMSARSDDTSDLSGSTKKSYDYYSETNPYPYPAHAPYLDPYTQQPYAQQPDHYTAQLDPYGTQMDHYGTQTDHYGTQVDHYGTQVDHYPTTPTDGYPPTPSDMYPGDAMVAPSEARSYVSSPPSESFLSVSCDLVAPPHGPPAYAPYPSYDASLRSSGSAKVPPPIPPKPKLCYTPEPKLVCTPEPKLSFTPEAYTYDDQQDVPPALLEKRVRNVTMV